MHKRRLQSVKSLIDNWAPYIPQSFNTKGCKKYKIEEEKLDEIKKNNWFLLKKMMNIDFDGTPVSPTRIQTP